MLITSSSPWKPRAFLVSHPQHQGFGQGSVFQGLLWSCRQGWLRGSILCLGCAGWILAQNLFVKSRLRPGGFIPSARGVFIVFILACVSPPQAGEDCSGSEASQQESCTACCPFCPGDTPGNAIPGSCSSWDLYLLFPPLPIPLQSLLSLDPQVLWLGFAPSLGSAGTYWDASCWEWARKSEKAWKGA